jgi:hypothetical protein
MPQGQEVAREDFLARMLSIIRKNPGIRPSELNRLLGRPHTAHYRNTLIERGLVRKERDGAAVHYYPVD